MKKLSLLLLTIIILSSFVMAKSNIVSVVDNGIKISSMEYASCKGTICTYEFTIENKESKDKDVEISNLFSDEIEIISIERLEDVEEEILIKNPDYLPAIFDNLTNITIQEESGERYISNKSVKKKLKKVKEINYTKEKKSFKKLKDKIDSSSFQKYRVQVYQPLGKLTKFDIITNNDDNTKTTLDPFVDTNNYIINQSDLQHNEISESYFTGTKSSTTITYANYNGGYTWDLNSEYNINDVDLSMKVNFGNLNADDNPDELILLFTNDEVSSESSVAGNAVGFWFSERTTWGASTGNPVVKFFNGSVYTSANEVVSEIDVGNNIRLNITGTSEDCRGSIYEDNILIFDVNTSCSNFNVTSFHAGAHYWDPGSSGGKDEITYASTGIDGGPSYKLSVGRTCCQVINNYLYFSDVEINSIGENQVNLDNLSIDSNFTGVKIIYSDSVLQLNDTALGNNLQNNTCYNIIDGETSLDWSIKLNTSITDWSNLVNYTFMDCSVKANESVARQCMINGIDDSLIDLYYAYYDRTIVIRLVNGSEYSGLFDIFIVSGNNRYAINYDENSSDSFPVMYNLSSNFYVWQKSNMSDSDVTNSVKNFIDATIND